MLTSIIGVVVLLGGLIFFHELGHYTIAKLFGVRVEVFSLGFGKKIFSKRIGDTEYCLSLFPLGGYVKLMGDDPYKGVPAADVAHAFSTQKLYKRFAVVAAGPLANLLLAFVLFSIVFFVGQPMPSTRIGNVVVNSQAWEAGFRSGDRVLDVGGQKLQTWTELEDYLKPKTGEKLDVHIDREGTAVTLPITIAKVTAKNPYGEDEQVGGIKGLYPYPLAPLIGVSSPDTAAYKAGLRSGDLITKIGDKALTRFQEIDELLAAQHGAEVVVSYKRGKAENLKDATEQTATVTLPANIATALTSPIGRGEWLGIYPSELFVRQVTAGSPAEKGGLQTGDRIAKIDGKAVYSFDTIVDFVQDLGPKEQPIAFTIERDGKSVPLSLRPVQMTTEDPLTRAPIKKFMVGFVPNTAYQEADLTKLKIHDPVLLVKHAAQETFTLAQRMVVSLAKLAVGKISVKNLGGPVLIASVAGKSLDAGIIPFLQMMALISINLFLLNLFPIPILDGGHLLFFVIEGIKGKPVSLRTMEIANQVGMVFILMLVGLTLFNDISRIVLH